MQESRFDKYTFWNEIKHIKREYGLRISNRPHARSAKRITILISTAYLKSGGSVHWVQCLESAIYRMCKARKLDCDRLEMEDNTQAYICRRKSKSGKREKEYGKKLYSNEFNEWALCTADSVNPEIETFANMLTDYLAQEEDYDDEPQLSGDCKREGDTRNPRHKEGRFSKTKKGRLALR